MSTKKRRLKWTCRYCGHTFTTWTRAALRVTCKNPKCGRVQEGPAGIELMAERLGRSLQQPSRPAPAQPVAVVAVKRRAPVANKKPAHAPAVGDTSARTPSNLRAANGKATAPPPAPTQQSRVGLVDRVLFGVKG